MNSRTALTILSCSAVLTLAAAPLSGYAGSDPTMDACIEAFIAERVPKNRALTIRKIDLTNSFYSQARTQRITLTATGKNSGTKFASAVCIVDESGDSVSLLEAGHDTTLAQSASAKEGAR
jgi:hypothetical protein